MRSDPISGRFLTFPKPNVKGESYYEEDFWLPAAKLLTTRGKWLRMLTTILMKRRQQTLECTWLPLWCLRLTLLSTKTQYPRSENYSFLVCCAVVPTRLRPRQPSRIRLRQRSQILSPPSRPKRITSSRSVSQMASTLPIRCNGNSTSLVLNKIKSRLRLHLKITAVSAAKWRAFARPCRPDRHRRSSNLPLFPSRGFGFHVGEVDQASLRSRSTGMSRVWRRDEDHQFHRASTNGCHPADPPPLRAMARLPPHPCLAASTA
jgi:hypothetical protein